MSYRTWQTHCAQQHWLGKNLPHIDRNWQERLQDAVRAFVREWRR